MIRTENKRITLTNVYIVCDECGAFGPAGMTDIHAGDLAHLAGWKLDETFGPNGRKYNAPHFCPKCREVKK